MGQVLLTHLYKLTSITSFLFLRVASLLVLINLVVYTYLRCQTRRTRLSELNHQERRGGGSMAMAMMQRVAVMRHGDRIDHAEPLWTANNPRPWDPPLTDAGLLRAWTVGNRIRSDKFQIHRVLVSPFFRCLQTAAQAVAALCALPDDNALLPLHDTANLPPLDPSRIKVSIEYGLSEMMNAQAMGLVVSQVAPSIDKWFPDLSQLEAALPAGTVDHSAEPLYLEVPKWGESVWEARSRYASVIKALADKYPDENLLLVTHGEGVGASVSFFEPGAEIYEVEYCAYSVLGRQQKQKHKAGLEGGEEEEEGLKNLRVLSTSGPTGIHYYYTTPAPAVAPPDVAEL